MNALELYQIARITKHSRRAQNARDMLGLADGEYVRNFGKGKTLTTNGWKKLTSVKDDYKYFHGDIQDYVQREIVDYFGLNIDVDRMMTAIFYNLPALEGKFTINSWVQNDGIATIDISLYELPRTKAQADGLLKEVMGHLEKLKWLKEVMLQDKMKTHVVPYKKIDEVMLFDERFEIAQKYLALRKQHAPKEIPANELGNLRKLADEMLPGSNIKATKDLISMVDDFKKIFYL
ncbi:MAG: hypothetical protein PHO20_00650 [Candidatus Peribacteraceae bacterium]|nr:hypothetical protein [Candidatus Peribacteraceae bacterium]MDD5739261.1 hypothetical protein [Candidatus Peribacteraceae bacterium]